MADEPQDTDNTDEVEDETNPEPTEHAEAAEEPAEDTEEQADHEHEEQDAFPRRLVLSARNLSVVGQLVVSYPSRDVVIPIMDGDAAVRILSAFHRRSDRGLGDHLDPRTSSARDVWVVLDAIEQPMAMTWIPGLPGKTPRTAIDPAVAD